jgi:membrane dipeptidase
MFRAAYRKLVEQCSKFDIRIINSYSDIIEITNNGGRGAIFTVENASVLAGKLENIELFSDFGVKLVTLTWNGRNELGDGAMVSHSNGIRPFGIEVIKKLEEKKIIIDVSHASDRLMYDIFNHTTRPLVASHTNSRAVAKHKRNMTDEQFLTIVKRGGIVGLNLHKFFLNTDGDKANKYDVLRHAEHFLSLGGEESLCFGADFDGCNLPVDILGIDTISDIYELFLKENYNEDTVKKIFYENALKFCKNFDK